MKGFLDKCVDCKYFSWRAEIPKKDCIPYAPLDGWCSKVFPRGYFGAGKEGRKVFHGKRKCFQFEQNDGQMVMRFEEEKQ